MQDDIQVLLNDLREFESKMSRDDLYDFQMLQKRQKDNEEFDRLSHRRLEELHKKYVVKKMVKEIDQLLKKYSKQVKEFGPGNGKGNSG